MRYNKADKADVLPQIPGGIPVSAKTGEGIDDLQPFNAKEFVDALF